MSKETIASRFCSQRRIRTTNMTAHRNVAQIPDSRSLTPDDRDAGAEVGPYERKLARR